MDAPLPGAWSNKRLLGFAVLGQLMMVMVATRHAFIYGGSFHVLLNVLESLGLIAATLVAGLALSRALRQANSVPLELLMRGGLLLTLVATLAPPFLSNDIWDYLARGRLDWLGHNPYTVAVAEHADEVGAFTDLARWTEWVLPYGPISALLQEWVSGLGSPWLAAYVWKLLMAACHVTTAILVLKTLRVVANERDARQGFVLWLWNPWLLLECCGSGHNDALLGMLLALSGYGLARARYALGTASYGMAMLVKHGSPPILPIWLATAYHQRQLRGFALGSLAVVGMITAAYYYYWTGPNGWDWILKQNNVAHGSLSSLLAGLFGETFGAAIRVLGAGLTLLMLLLACKRAREAQSGARLAILAMAVFVMLSVPNFAPWYQMWWLPLFALANLPVLTCVLKLLAWTGPLSYLVLTSTHGFGLAHETWMLLMAGVWPCMLILLDWREFVGRPPKTKAT